MTLFGIIWASTIVAILILAFFIELNGARNGFQGANGIFMFASGMLTLLSLPIVLIVTWIGEGFWTALKVCLIGVVAYGALFTITLLLLDKSVRSIAAATRKR